MPAISLPFNISNGDPLDADAVMADLQGIVATVNGGLELGPNVKAAGPPTAITGKDNSAGVSVSGLRSDAQFVIQGVENVTAKPTTGNFLGRLVYVTAGGDIGKAFICTDATGTGTFKAFANQAATDVTLHAAQHADGGADQLTDTSIAERSMKARTIYSVVQTATVGPLTNDSWTTVVDLTGVTTTGVQTVLVTVNANARNTGGNGTKAATVLYRVIDQTAGGTPTIFRSHVQQLGLTGGGNDASMNSFSFPYTVPATGARTLRLQAYADATGGSGSSSVITIFKTSNGGGEPLDTPTMQAVIL